MIKAFLVTSLAFPKFYLRASNCTFSEVDGGRAQARTSRSLESFRLPAAVSRLYNEGFVPLPAGSPPPGSPAISSSDFWDVLGQGSARIVIPTGLQLLSIMSHSLRLNSPFESCNRFLEEEEVEAELSLLARGPVSAGLASGTKPAI